MKQFTGYLFLLLLAIAVVTTTARLVVLWFRPTLPKPWAWLGEPPSRRTLTLYYILVIAVCAHSLLQRLETI